MPDLLREAPPRPAPAADRRPAAVVVAVAICVLAWASAFVVIRGVGAHFSGGALALARLLVGAVLLGLPLLGRPWPRPTAREWALVAAYGFSWFGLYNVALNVAEHTLDAGTAAMIVNIGPLLIALGAGIFLGERLSAWLAIGSAVAFVGAILIGLGAGSVRLGNGTGVVLALLAAFAYAGGVLCQKVALRRLPAAQVTWLGCLFGAALCLPFLGGLVGELRAAPPGAIAGALYLGAVPTAVAFSAWSFALARLPAGQLGVTTYLVPALVVLLGFVAFGEVPAPLAIAGGAVCLGGVALSRRRAA